MTNSHPDIAEGLAGQLLIATPQMSDRRFRHSLVYMIEHGIKGAMGLVVNKPSKRVTFEQLLAQLDIEASLPLIQSPIIHNGGPLEPNRGFALHTNDYTIESTVSCQSSISMTAHTDIIRDIAHGRGPAKVLVALGFAHWDGGQLESEIEQIAWIHIPADEHLVFADGTKDKWNKALQQTGFNIMNMSPTSGHA